ncbi:MULTISPECIES: DUF3975 family protein [unclassified Bacillus (in: firmicutes)]|uniref:DUF3975 family protein n=1 Tax=Bacillus bruguierae TaxID=3127667 RepID=A0ABU8FCB8_9BACI|nr:MULTISPECIES: DUF3975 family protein [unclassified Bacillus (in: firmicutes)]SFI49073.1 Protein of unknown function [Bacillus sp. 71mf]SFS49316.1 Protein of unknown function [Bacillus sp. 103mf]
MWKKRVAQIMMGILIAIVFLLQTIFHIAEWLFYKVFAILTFLPNMALEVTSVIWSIIASIGIIIIWSIAKLWNKLVSKDSSSNKK